MDIVGIGNPCIDIISVVDKLPTPNKGAGILDCSRQGGGVVPTAIVAASRLGADAGFVGLSGTCVHSGAIREDFEYNGVDISRSVTVNGACSDFALILSDLETKGRSILYKRGNLRALTVNDLDREYLTGAAFLHLDGCGETQKTAAVWMREAGKKVSFDASHYSKTVKNFLPYIDIFIASEFYYETAFGSDPDYEKNCRIVSESGPETAAFTLGEKGCVGYSKTDGFFAFEGYKVNAVDTVGAGDVFHGAFLAGLSKGWTAAKSAVFANAASAVKIGFIGGRAGIPSFETAEKFLNTGQIDDSELKQRVEYYKNKWLYGI